MSITGSSIHRFRSRVDGVLQDVWPVTLLIAGSSVAASGPGGRTMTEFVDGGESRNFRFSFRVPKSEVPSGWSPSIGAAIDWIVDAETTIPMEIADYSIRPQEDRYAITCRRRRMP